MNKGSSARSLVRLASVVVGIFALCNAFDLYGQVERDTDIDITLTEGTMFSAVASPDRRQIAMDLAGGLWVLPIEGGDARRITPDAMEARRPTWSPDNRSLAFQGYDTAWHLYTVGADGSGLRQLTNGPFDDREPDWSRDGRRIVFSSDRFGGISSIWEVGVDTGLIRQVSAFVGHDPCWSESDRDIVFRGRPAAQPSALPGLWIVGPDGREQPLTISPRAPNERLTGRGPLPNDSIAPCGSGRTFAVANAIASADEDVFPMPSQWIRPGQLLYTADGHIKLGASNASRVVPFRATLKLHRPPYQRALRDIQSEEPHPALGIVNPAVSPDGTRVAFTALGDLWLLEQGRQPQQLTNDPFVELDPVWSPDGTRLAFASDRSGHMDLWVHDFSSGADAQLTKEQDSGTVSGPAWSPDGQQIAYLVNRRALHLVDVVAASRGGQFLMQHATEIGRPTWPPDGKRIAIGGLLPYTFPAADPEGTNQLLLYAFTPTPSAALLLLHRSAGNRINNGPVWSPDGARMAYAAEGSLWVIGVGSGGAGLGDPQRVADDTPDSPSWQADSQHIVYLSTDRLRRVSVDSGRTEDIPIGIGWRRAAPDLMVVHAGALLDATSPSVRLNIDIVVDKGRILAVEPHQDAMHAAGRIIDAANGTVMPGLIDMHAHLDSGYGEALGRLLLAYGVTTVRDPEAAAFGGLEQRESYDAGRRIGPRLFLAADPMTGGRVLEAGARPIVSEPHLMQELERDTRLASDFFSTYRRLPDSYLRRIVEYGQAHGVSVATAELFPAVAFGTDVVEGLRDTGRQGIPTRVSPRGVSYRDVVDTLVKSGVTLTPMLGPREGVQPGAFMVKAARDRSLLDDPRLSLMPPSHLAQLRADAAFWRERPQELTRLAVRVGTFGKTVAAMVTLGARVASGSGAPAVAYGLGVHVELEELVDGGLTPFQALRTATVDAARALGAADVLGSIEPGKCADLVIVGGDPIRDIRAARDVRAVIRGGQYYDLPTLLAR